MSGVTVLVECANGHDPVRFDRRVTCFVCGQPGGPLVTKVKQP